MIKVYDKNGTEMKIHEVGDINVQVINFEFSVSPDSNTVFNGTIDNYDSKHYNYFCIGARIKDANMGSKKLNVTNFYVTGSTASVAIYNANTYAVTGSVNIIFLKVKIA